MIEICSRNDCTGCGACASVCPASCITMVKDQEGFAHPAIEEDKCLGCFKCKKACPSGHALEREPAEFYMAWNRREDVRRDSSSGGVFSALAELVLRHGGVVVGACQDEETGEVRHIVIEDPSDLGKLRRSKYAQSDAGQIYQIVTEYLDEHRFVLFSGTPCQIAAIKAVISGNQEYLITADVLCHGVTSQKVVDAYIRAKEEKYGKSVVRYVFRTKDEVTSKCPRGGVRRG